MMIEIFVGNVTEVWRTQSVVLHSTINCTLRASQIEEISLIMKPSSKWFSSTDLGMSISGAPDPSRSFCGFRLPGMAHSISKFIMTLRLFISDWFISLTDSSKTMSRVISSLSNTSTRFPKQFLFRMDVISAIFLVIRLKNGGRSQNCILVFSGLPRLPPNFTALLGTGDDHNEESTRKRRK